MKPKLVMIYYKISNVRIKIFIFQYILQIIEFINILKHYFSVVKNFVNNILWKKCHKQYVMEKKKKEEGRNHTSTLAVKK